MKPRKWKKILKMTRSTLYQAAAEPQTYSVRWLRPGTGPAANPPCPPAYGYRVFAADSIERALRIAPGVAGLAPATPAHQDWPLDRAFATALKAAHRGAKATNDWQTYTRQFVEWLVANHPQVGYWHQIDRPLVREYMGSLPHLSPNALRMRVQPLQQTDAHMTREHGFARVADALRIPQTLVRPTATVYLADVFPFLSYLRANAPALEVGAALQALAGLRVQEVTRLSWSKVDLGRGLLEISGQVKTAWSVRVIPLARRVVEALRRSPQGIGNALVVDDRGDWRNYSAVLTRAIRHWNPAVNWTSKDLRNCLPTYAASQGIDGPLWEQYIGHAPKGVTARHYIPRLLAPTAGETTELDKAMDLFRETIIAPIDAAEKAASKKAKQESASA